MEYYQLDPRISPSGFMQGTAAEVWGEDTHEVMQGTFSSWKDNDMYLPLNFLSYLISIMVVSGRNKLNHSKQ
jgi:hypothetical protein